MPQMVVLSFFGFMPYVLSNNFAATDNLNDHKNHGRRRYSARETMNTQLRYYGSTVERKKDGDCLGE